ncbi:uncharacterized protein LOC115715121 [Cannabis sativa]|uniref:uncharacterized protein LOC115715121 n=1 Tax=Cannabis sativa TaxID=3483 RepID=UPI0029CA4EB6|nr:uncharacterized protein LOC115715121 [Cannabis sativa]
MKATPRRHQQVASSPFLRSGRATTDFVPEVNPSNRGDDFATKSATTPKSNPAFNLAKSHPKQKGIVIYDNQEEDEELINAELKRKRFAIDKSNPVILGQNLIRGHGIEISSSGSEDNMGPIDVNENIESKNVNVEVVERIKAQLSFEGCFCVEAQGHKAGIALLWKVQEEVRLLQYGHNFIDAEIIQQHSTPWRLTGIYGEPNRSLRFNTWKLIHDLATLSQLPWCLIGDLNNIGSQSEKKGGRPYPAALISGFQEVLQSCDLIDLELQGHPFTWERSKGTSNSVEISLDKALVSHVWLQSFPQATLTNGDFSSSDHTPIFLEPKPPWLPTKKYFFRYENCWSREPLCSQLVEDCLKNNAMLTLAERIKACSVALDSWGHTLTGNFKKRLSKTQQELYWKQRSKQHWLHGGDKNSKYFHAYASNRKRNNQIHSLQDSRGVMKDWDSGLETNNDLLQPIQDEEVKQALFQMHPDKAPDPDGMGPGFYQTHWAIVGKDVIKFVNDFFISGNFPSGINETNLVLIPKKKNFSSMSDLRPIALCNVLYKVAAKVLANRMRHIIDKVISDTQSAFIPGRLISDNVMVAFEIMHYLKRKMKGKKGYMALKLDMSKAYDRAEWGYLHAIMARMGFADRWINLIMQCVSSVRYTIVHSGRTIRPIAPTRGIRQGDPLSTYLFIICVEGFSSLIQQSETNGSLRGIRVAHRPLPITHMLFADDSYLFCQATNEAANTLLHILHFFEIASGQKVNASKSNVFFSPNTSSSARDSICSILGMVEASEGSHYLGLFNIIGRNKNAIMGFLKNKVINRLNTWHDKFLSRAGKEILLKTVIQSLPTYAMSVFLIPSGTIDEIEKLMARFWWKTSSSKWNGIIWMSWERMATHKHNGGMGFRHLSDFNLAMLAKQGWRLLCNPNSLASRVYKAKYFPNSDFLRADLGSNPSFIWRSIWSAQKLIKLGARRTIRTGIHTSILDHPWLPDKDNLYVTTTNPGLSNQSVSALLSIDSCSWDHDLVTDMFNHRDAPLILGPPLSSSNLDDDCWYWTGESNGSFSVSSAYSLLQQSKHPRPAANNFGFWKELWQLKIPPKVKTMLWRAVTNCLPTCLNLVIKHVNVSVLCPMCDGQPENTSHALIECPLAAAC